MGVSHVLRESLRRAEPERLERELARDVKVHIVNGMSGELAAVAGGLGTEGWRDGLISEADFFGRKIQPWRLESFGA